MKCKLLIKKAFSALERDGIDLRCMRDRTTICSSRCVAFDMVPANADIKNVKQVLLRCGHEPILFAVEAEEVD